MLAIYLCACALLTATPPLSPTAPRASQLSVRVAPAPDGGRVWVGLQPSWEKPFQVELAPEQVEPQLGATLEAGRPSTVVLTVDTRLSYDVGAAALSALRAHGVEVELRFAGPTRQPDGSMPPVLKLMKEVSAPPPLSRPQLEEAVSAAYPKLRGCYQKELEANALSGTLVVSFTIGKEGTVETATVRQSELARPDIQQCIEGVVRQLKFPPLRGAPFLRVTWPFRFERASRPPPRSADGGRVP